MADRALDSVPATPALGAERIARGLGRRGRPVRLTWARIRLTLAIIPLAATIIAAAFAPTLAPQDPVAPDLDARLRPPFWLVGGSLVHLLGTDQIGRDVLSRIIYGARISLPIALAASSLGAVIGVSLGAASGYLRGRVDGVLTKVMDIQLSFPFLLFAISVIAVSGPGVRVLVLVLTIGSWVAYARIVRGMVLSLREKEFVQAARALGVSVPRIISRQIFPNVLPTALVVGTLDVGRIIILEATLSFLGLGVQPPTPSWGMSLSDAREYIQIAWWTATFPGLAIMVVVLSVNQLGDVLRDMLDPRLRVS
jgi:peptide/nickel transport system permease protein